jgi:competence protein ComEA
MNNTITASASGNVHPIGRSSHTAKASRFRSFLKVGTLLATCTLAPALAWSQDVSININTASAEEIADALKGVGLKRAQAIVAWREKNGDFTSLDQLTVIKGIGDSTLAKNQQKIQL